MEGVGERKGVEKVQKRVKSAQYRQPGEERREMWMKERKGHEKEEENGIKMGGGKGAGGVQEVLQGIASLQEVLQVCATVAGHSKSGICSPSPVWH
jgi:hypothetical protein